MRKPSDLKITEFYDIYGISLLLNKSHDKELLPILIPIAQKYLKITDWAVRKEVAHFFWENDDDIDELAHKSNMLLIKSMKLRKNFNSKKLTLEQIYKIFHKGEWDCDYGGYKWATITKNCIKLDKMLSKAAQLNELIIQIDHMNDLEHNNELYLADFCDFALDTALNLKAKAEPEIIIKYCSTKIKSLYHGNLSLVAQFHEKEG